MSSDDARLMTRLDLVSPVLGKPRSIYPTLNSCPIFPERPSTLPSTCARESAVGHF